MAALGRLSAVLQEINSNSFSDDEERAFAEDLLLKALAKIRSPWDTAWTHVWVNPATNAATTSLIEAGVFKKWVEYGSKPQTSGELAKLTGTDPALISK